MAEGVLRGPLRPASRARNHLVEQVAAKSQGLHAGHPDWVALSDEQRQVYYRRASEIITVVADELLVLSGNRTTGELVADD